MSASDFTGDCLNLDLCPRFGLTSPPGVFSPTLKEVSVQKEKITRRAEQHKSPQQRWNETNREVLYKAQVELSQMEGTRTIAIVMNASTFNCANEIDYLITNVDDSTATAEWIVTTYAQRNWVEVFYKEAKGLYPISLSSFRGTS